MEVKRLFDIPYYQNEKFPQQDAFVDKVVGHWVKVSTQEYIDYANSVSRALIKLGIQPGDKIALISNNRSEWNICDIGIQQVGAISVPVYPTIDSDSYAYIFNDAQVKLCVVSDQELADKVNSIKSQVPSLQEIYSFVDCKGAINWKALNASPDKELDAEIEKRKAAILPDDLVTLIYTSGTTGNPKGVMLSHNNLLSNVKACEPRLPVDSSATSVSFLPVCHVYERMLLYLYQYTGVSIYFAESLDTIGDNLKEVKPDIFTAVPRLLEKVFDKIVAKGDELTGIKHKLFFWALALGEEYDVRGKSAWYHFKLKIARKLIFSKWQEALGGNVKAIACGSAALQPRLARVFMAAGIPVMEGYGLTETSPVISVNMEKDNKYMIGTTGTVLEHITVKIAEDGEILVKGPNVMMGYYNQPDKTAEVIDADGWFHTGDIGTLVDGEYLKITDRKKEIFKTSGGKYIAPQVMENKFKESRFIEQIMVIGENQKMPAALIVPDLLFVQEWAKRKSENVSTYDDMASSTELKERIAKEIEQYNEGFGNWEKIKVFEIVPNAWTVEGGELTPTMKPKRKEIMKKYNHLVEKIYGKNS